MEGPATWKTELRHSIPAEVIAISAQVVEFMQ